MRRKHIALIVVAVVVLSACTRPRPAEQQPSPFVDVVRLPATPVKQQGRSELCWLYAMLATIETDRIVAGDSLNLSVDYLARRRMEQCALQCHFAGNDASISMRGMATTALRLIGDYGLMAYDSYNTGGETNYVALARRVAAVAHDAPDLDTMDTRVATLLDNTLGTLPPHVWMYGAGYSVGEFGRSVCRPSDYEALTSFTHHPFGTPFALEVPDNIMNDEFANVPLDTLMQRIDNALEAGTAVCWEGDVSEPGFSFERGVAELATGEPATQQRRQRHFESRQTTDDHCMTIVGMARDADGRTYYIAKNSWGTHNPYGGYVYMSADYVRMKTIAVVVRRADKRLQPTLDINKRQE